jgi:hypothetical protein
MTIISTALLNQIRTSLRRRIIRGALMRKPTMLVVVALANKIARIAWALMAHGGIYRTPARAA